MMLFEKVRAVFFSSAQVYCKLAASEGGCWWTETHKSDQAWCMHGSRVFVNIRKGPSRP